MEIAKCGLRAMRLSGISGFFVRRSMNLRLTHTPMGYIIGVKSEWRATEGDTIWKR